MIKSMNIGCFRGVPVLEVPQSGNYKKPIQFGWAFVLEQNGIEVHAGKNIVFWRNNNLELLPQNLNFIMAPRVLFIGR